MTYITWPSVKLCKNIKTNIFCSIFHMKYSWGASLLQMQFSLSGYETSLNSVNLSRWKVTNRNAPTSSYSNKNIQVSTNNCQKKFWNNADYGQKILIDTIPRIIGTIIGVDRKSVRLTNKTTSYFHRVVSALLQHRQEISVNGQSNTTKNRYWRCQKGQN